MSIESNKQLARDILAAAAGGNMAALDALMTDDATWWLLPTMGGLYTKKEFLAMLPRVWASLESPLDLQLIDLTAEDDRVSVTFTGQAKAKNGKNYNNHYHVLFFVRDGKMAAVKEYFDSAHAHDVFGPMNA